MRITWVALDRGTVASKLSSDIVYFRADSSLPVDPLAGNTSDKPVSDEGLSSVVVGVVAVDVQNIQKLVGNWGVTSFLYGNIVGCAAPAITSRQPAALIILLVSPLCVDCDML